jgi:IS5 family transposase
MVRGNPFRISFCTKPTVFFKKTYQLIGTKGTRLLRKKRVQGRPHRRKERRGGSRTARGKRVPGVEINVSIVQTLKKTVGKINYYRVVL